MALWFKRKKEVQSLPANIHDASSATIEKKSGQWLEEINSIRLAQAEAELEAAKSDKPLFYLAAERLAKEAGKTREALLEEYAQHLRESKYPTPECLRPDEIQIAEEGKLAEARKKHLSSCSACSTLLSATKPPTELTELVRQEFARAVEPPAARGGKGKPPPIPLAWLLKPMVLAGGGGLLLLAMLTTFFFMHGLTSGPRVQSLAVLPIQNVSGGSDQDYLAYGMTERLITDLGSIKGLRVIGNNSVMQFQKTNEQPREIARKLNVDAVAKASMVHQGNRVRISAQLIQASTNQKLWSGSFERDLDEALELQDDVARTLASITRVKLSKDEKARLTAMASVPSRVLLLYMEGRYRLGRRDKEDIEASLEAFSKVVKEAPKFALGWASVADSYNLLALRGHIPPLKAYPEARQSATKALALDPNLANAHAALALSDQYNEFNWAEAEKELRLALQLNPSYAAAHHWYGLLLSALKRHTEAIQELKLAVEQEPLYPTFNSALGDGYFVARQYDQAIKQYKETLKNYNYEDAKRNLASVYVQTGNYEEAVKLLHQVKDNVGDLAYAYAVWGRKAEARTLLPQLEDPFEIAVVYGALGERDSAFEWLDKAYEQRSFLLVNLGVDPALDPLRSDSRFQDLLRRIHYPSQNP